MDMTRIETFTDPAFAFALTLLVVSLDIPTSYGELTDVLRGIPAFGLSATLLMLFWAGHHAWSRRYGLDDAPTILLSCLLVFTVLVYVYPLKFMTRALTGWLSQVTGIARGSGFAVEVAPSEINRLFIVYSAGFVAMCAAIVLLNLHAWRNREGLQLDELERFDTRTEIGAWLTVGSAGVLSMLLAIATPPSWVGVPGWAYLPLAVVMPIYGTVTGRRRRKLLGQE
jgi:uncharacterized membrane protein